MSWQEYEFFSTQILSFILLHETDLEQCAICTSTAVIVIKRCDSANIYTRLDYFDMFCSGCWPAYLVPHDLKDQMAENGA